MKPTSTFRPSASSPLKEIETMAHPEGRLHDRDMTSDLPGKDVGGDGSGAHAYQSKTDPKQRPWASDLTPPC